MTTPDEHPTHNSDLSPLPDEPDILARVGFLPTRWVSLPLWAAF